MHGLGRRQRLYHGVVAIALMGGLLAGGSGGGLGGLGDLLGGLLGGGADAGTPGSPGSSVQPGGHLHMADQKLRKGCQRYSYSYAITVPAGDEFDLEIFVTDPRGVSQGSDVILSGADSLSGVKSLTICRSNTVSGTFALRGTLYTNDGVGPTTTTVLPTDTFKLTVHTHKDNGKKHHKKHRHAHKHAHKHQKRHR
jgi:hypothetical protein